MRLLLLPLALLGLLVGCADKRPAYRPFSGTVGYDHASLRPGEITVYYTGPEGMGLGTATELAKARAAELARGRGAAAFTVLASESTVVQDVDYIPGHLTGGFAHRDDPRYVRGTRYSPGHLDYDRYPRVRLDVRLGEGPDALRVEDVLAEVAAATVHYPPPARPPAKQ